MWCIYDRGIIHKRITNLVGSYLSELPNVARFVGTKEYSGTSVGEGSILCGGGECTLWGGERTLWGRGV